jgi:putative membrane protein
MRKVIGALALVCVVCAAPVAGQAGGSANQGQPKPGTTGAKPEGAMPSSGAGADAMFMRTAAMDGMAEVEHGRLAAQNAMQDDVKQFAQRMVADHGKAGDELKALASQKNVTLPTELDAKHKAMQDKLSKMKGADFDRAYMAHMVTAHQQAVALFEKEASGGKDAEAKAWAGKTLPTLQEHLKMARAVKPAGSAAK